MIGQVKISKDVIATVVAVAVREVPGISGISNTVPD